MHKPYLTAAVLAAALLVPLAGGAPRAASAAAVASPTPAVDARVIVKYRADSTLLRRTAASASRSADTDALGQRLGLAFRAGRSLDARTQVVFASGMTSADLAQRLSAQVDVEYAVPDKRRRALAVPNDPLYATGSAIVGRTGGPVSGQWYLRSPAAPAVSAINAEAAWDVATGSAGIVVAVLDTGARYDHADLKPVAEGGVLLPGYDMLGPDRTNSGTSKGSFLIANDGSGRDADASDPGDWITEAEANQVGGEFHECTALDPVTGRYRGVASSWHGTQTIGVVGAMTNNGLGIASVGRGVRVLPVRVLGKCGGYDSDIVAGMLWAAGIDVPDAPRNPNPAQVLNLSLGGADSCNALYRDTVNQVLARGSVIVASAGNDEGHAVNVPASCPGVIGVAGLRHIGSKVGFSDVGPEVSISAPGGNCVNTGGGDACLYPIVTTTNAGSTAPVAAAAGGSTYTDAFDVSVGTSYSSPLVAGTAALMLSVQPQLTPAELLAKLQRTARPFPTTGAAANIRQCEAPRRDSNGDYVDQDECYCTTATCGAGMLDAAAAVQSAAGVQARIATVTPAPMAGSAVSLSAASSLLTAGRSITSYRWALVDGGGIAGSFTGAVDGAVVSLTPTAAGAFRVELTAVDSSGTSSTATTTVNVAAAPVVVPPPTSGGGGGGGAVDWGWLAMLAAAVLALAALRQRSKF